MLDVLFQIVLPFVLSALVVILITVIAEKYGTKVGGIIGTLPTTIIIAFVFIALNRGVDFASESSAVVPAEMGINLIFLCIFAILAYKSLFSGLTIGFAFWIIFSSILFFTDMNNIYISLSLFFASMVATFIVLEKVKKIKSQGRQKVHYTPFKIILRGILTGTIIAVSVALSNLDPVLSGIFSIFPAIFMSTMIISYREHGPDFSAGIAKSMIFGSLSVMSYVTVIHFLYPSHGIFVGSLFAFIIAVFVSLVILKVRNKIS